MKASYTVVMHYSRSYSPNIENIVKEVLSFQNGEESNKDNKLLLCKFNWRFVVELGIEPKNAERAQFS